MSLTMPQVLMLNHAASVNKRRMDILVDGRKKSGAGTLDTLNDSAHQEEPVWGGKKWSELNSDEMAAYLEA